MIFDDKQFLLGGYYGESVRGEDRNLYIQNEVIGATINHYFDYVWNKARLFNVKRDIVWDEIQYCGTQLGYTTDELNAIVSQIAEDVGFRNVKLFK